MKSCRKENTPCQQVCKYVEKLHLDLVMLICASLVRMLEMDSLQSIAIY